MIKIKQIYALFRTAHHLRNLSPISLTNKPLLCHYVSQSKFYQPRVPVQTFLNSQGVEFNSNSSSVLRLKFCPFCKKPHHNEITNLYTLNVNKQSGLYFCHRCSSKGSYLTLRQAILGVDINSVQDQIFDSPESRLNANQPSKYQKISQVEYFIYKENMKKQEFKDVIQYLQSRGLSKQTIETYNIGCGYQKFYQADGDSQNIKVMYFPMYKLLNQKQKRQKILSKMTQNAYPLNFVSQIAKIKIRGVGKENKKFMRQMPEGPSRGFFGLQLIKKSDKLVVITEGQLDAMSVYQVTGIPSISLPQGANSLPDTILPYLDQFQKIILWTDNDEAGKVNLEKFAQKLGVARTHIVINHQKDLKDANDFLQKKPELISIMINKAKNLPDQNLINFQSIRDSIKQRLINGHKYEGIKLDSFPFFNKKVKGFRMGELSIVSGGTGSGKTTLLSQMSLQLSKKKVPILWGSFQIRNQILISNMLNQFSQVSLAKHKHQFDFFADKFTQLPLYFMSFHGSNQVNKVLGTISYAIQKYGVSLIVIDTLQFLLSNQAEGYKRFQLQDYVISQLRKIATTFNAHIVVVIHPRKTQDNEDIGIHSVYGTSKATQQADNVWIIQNRDGFKILDIKKNRYDGQVGRVAMGFNKPSKSFFELNKKELQMIYNKQSTASELYEIRLDNKDSYEEILQEDVAQHSFEFERKNRNNRKY